MIEVGTRVHLRGAAFGAAGEVVRMMRGKAVVRWPDLDFVSRHRPETLTEEPPNNDYRVTHTTKASTWHREKVHKVIVDNNLLPSDLSLSERGRDFEGVTGGDAT